MITVSLCMIVKNEEAVLKRCLDSIYDLMDEIIIVDTGSSDKTKEIAGTYTDKVYDFAWTGDFSAARNASFSRASMDYIYAADADEILEEEERIKFASMKETLDERIEIVQMIYCNQLFFNTTYNFDEEYRPKLYKRIRSFVWEDAIHEAVRLEPVVYDSGIRIKHCPVCSHGSRDFEAFRRLTGGGIVLSKKLFHMYARELFIAGSGGDFLEAEDYFRKALKEETRSLDEIKEGACVLSRISRMKKDAAGLLKYASKELASNPSSELCYELGEYYYENGDYEEAAIWYYNAANETTSILNIHFSGDYPLLRLSDCYQKMGNEEQASYYKNAANEWLSAANQKNGGCK